MLNDLKDNTRTEIGNITKKKYFAELVPTFLNYVWRKS